MEPCITSWVLVFLSSVWLRMLQLSLGILTHWFVCYTVILWYSVNWRWFYSTRWSMVWWLWIGKASEFFKGTIPEFTYSNWWKPWKKSDRIAGFWPTWKLDIFWMCVIAVIIMAACLVWLSVVMTVWVSSGSLAVVIETVLFF